MVPKPEEEVAQKKKIFQKKQKLTDQNKCPPKINANKSKTKNKTRRMQKTQLLQYEANEALAAGPLTFMGLSQSPRRGPETMSR